MYEILDNAGIQIIRVGLKSSDIMAEETAFHPAFRQLVEGSIARDRLEAQLTELLASLPVTQASHMPSVLLIVAVYRSSLKLSRHTLPQLLTGSAVSLLACGISTLFYGTG